MLSIRKENNNCGLLYLKNSKKINCSRLLLLNKNLYVLIKTIAT